jgi:hypothetical protein
MPASLHSAHLSDRGNSAGFRVPAKEREAQLLVLPHVGDFGQFPPRSKPRLKKL